MTSFFGVSGTPGPDEVARARTAKMLTWEGLARALDEGVARERSAALIDATYGMDAILAAKAGGVRAAVPVEASGQEELVFEYADWQTRLREIDPKWAKVLVRYDPDGDAEMNRAQRSKMRGVTQRCRDAGRGFMLEVLVPPSPTRLAAVGSDRARYNAEMLPDLLVRAIDEIRLDEVAPDVWKIEGLDRTEDCSAVAQTAGATCIVLGKGADRDAVDRWLRAAAPVPGFDGFAIGRSIWWDPLQAFFAEGQTDEGRERAVAAIAAEFRRYVGVWEDASG